jgi:hypothetical protein
MNVTVPVAPLVTVAVKVTDVPYVDVGGVPGDDDAKFVVVGIWFTV